MNHCADCKGSITSQDFETWGEYGICDSCLSNRDNPDQACQICNVSCKPLLEGLPNLCGGDFCIKFPDKQIEDD